MNYNVYDYVSGEGFVNGQGPLNIDLPDLIYFAHDRLAQNPLARYVVIQNAATKEVAAHVRRVGDLEEYIEGAPEDLE